MSRRFKTACSLPVRWIRSIALSLTGLANLKELDLTRTRVVDLSPLTGLGNLESLVVTGTSVSKQELARLRKALPNLKISHGSPERYHSGLMQPGLLQEVVAVGGVDGDALQGAVARDGERDVGAGGGDRPDLAGGRGEVGDARAGDLEHEVAGLD